MGLRGREGIPDRESSIGRKEDSTLRKHKHFREHGGNAEQ